MSTSLPPVDIPTGEWVDLYASTGIIAGTKLIIQNNNDAIAILTESATKPVSGYGSNTIKPYDFFTNASGNVGAWAMSSRGTTLQVEEA